MMRGPAGFFDSLTARVFVGCFSVQNYGRAALDACPVNFAAVCKNIFTFFNGFWQAFLCYMCLAAKIMLFNTMNFAEKGLKK